MTVTELSRITGYSISTVSKALSDSSEIGADAKQKILKAARDTGYYEKTLKRKKRLGAPKTVCVVCDEYSDFRALRNLSRELDDNGYKTIITMNADGAKTAELLGADCVLFFRREPVPCSLPFVVFEDDVYETAEQIIKGDFEEEQLPATENNPKSAKKEDIWLF